MTWGARVDYVSGSRRPGRADLARHPREFLVIGARPGFECSDQRFEPVPCTLGAKRRHHLSRFVSQAQSIGLTRSKVQLGKGDRGHRDPAPIGVCIPSAYSRSGKTLGCVQSAKIALYERYEPIHIGTFVLVRRVPLVWGGYEFGPGQIGMAEVRV